MKSIRILLVILLTLCFSQLALSQSAKENKTEDNKEYMMSVSKVQSASDDVIFYEAKIVKANETVEALIIANCKENTASIIAMKVAGNVYKVMLKMSKPVKDSPAEISMLSACSQKPKTEN